MAYNQSFQYKQYIMEKAYKHLGFFIIFLLLIVIWGFYKTYFVPFPAFKGITSAMHFHGAMLLSWFLLLIVQPFLIRYGKTQLHRNIGKLSYVIMPMLLFSIYLMTRGQYVRQASEVPHVDNVANIALSFPTIFAFGGFYSLALKNKHHTAYHMRYMICTALMMLAPGTGRALIIYAGMPFPAAVNYALLITEMLTLILVLYDLFKKNPYKPFLIALLIFTGLHLIWVGRYTAAWQFVGEKIAQWLF